MGLVEEFRKATRYEYQEYAGAHPSTWEMDEEDLVKCAQIAENFAIGFAEWIVKDDQNLEYYTRLGKTKELLEIYKKTL